MKKNNMQDYCNAMNQIIKENKEDSHFIVCVPYIAEDGMFGRIESNYKNREYVGPEMWNK